MLRIGKLKIHSSFFFVLILIIALGQIKQFFLLLLATTIHELSHIIAARFFGLRIDGILITPIGESAYLEGFERLSAFKKNIILLAGPLANIVPAAVMLVFGVKEDSLSLFIFMWLNFSIGAFNLLPIYPFDGGKLLFVYLGNRLGILRSIPYVRNAAKAGIGLLFFAGFMQLILFPLNISIIAISLFLISVFQKEKGGMVFSYYKCMLGKPGRLSEGIKITAAAFECGAFLKEAERFFTWDSYCVVYVLEQGELSATLTESQIFQESLEEGVFSKTKLLDIIRHNDIIGENL